MAEKNEPIPKEKYGDVLSQTDMGLFAAYLEANDNVKEVKNVARLYFSIKSQSPGAQSELEMITDFSQGVDQLMSDIAHFPQGGSYSTRLDELRKTILQYLSDAKPRIKEFYKAAEKSKDLLDLINSYQTRKPEDIDQKQMLADIDKVYRVLQSKQEAEDYSAKVEEKGLEITLERLKLIRDFISDGLIPTNEKNPKELLELKDEEVAKFIDLYKQYKKETIARRYNKKGEVVRIPGGNSDYSQAA